MNTTKTASGLEVIKRAHSTISGKDVLLTRKTNKAGEIRHGVVLEGQRYSSHKKVGTFTELAPAFKAFKALAQA